MRLTLQELDKIVAEYVDATKIGQIDFQASHDNIANLIDKIGRMVSIDKSFSDKLPELDGPDLPLGKIVEEYYENLIAPSDYDENGADALAPSYPTYAPASYSYSLGRKVIKTTLKQNTYERACNNAAEATSLVNMVLKRLYDSFALYKYGIKKEALGKIVDKIYQTYDGTKFVASSSYAIGTHVASNETKDAVCIKNYPGTGASSLEDAIAKGFFIVSTMAVTMPNPLKAAEGETRQKALKEWLIQVKKDVETASFATEGNSFNGNTVGSEDGLLLIVPKGIMPLLQVEIEAGAFNPDKLAIPATIKVVDELKNGGNDVDVFGILMDPRMVAVHNDYQAIREQANGSGDFINYYMHSENTVFVSNNTFCKAYATNWNI